MEVPDAFLFGGPPDMLSHSRQNAQPVLRSDVYPKSQHGYVYRVCIGLLRFVLYALVSVKKNQVFILFGFAAREQPCNPLNHRCLAR